MGGAFDFNWPSTSFGSDYGTDSSYYSPSNYSSYSSPWDSGAYAPFPSSSPLAPSSDSSNKASTPGGSSAPADKTSAPLAKEDEKVESIKGRFAALKDTIKEYEDQLNSIQDSDVKEPIKNLFQSRSTGSNPPEPSIKAIKSASTKEQIDATLEAADAITAELKDTTSKIKDLVKAQKAKLNNEFYSVQPAINRAVKSLYVLESIKRATDEEKTAEEKAKATPSKDAPKEETTKSKESKTEVRSKIMGKHERTLDTAYKNLRRALAS